MRQKWHHIMITVKLKIHTKTIDNVILMTNILGMTYGEHSTNSIYY